MMGGSIDERTECEGIEPLDATVAGRELCLQVSRGIRECMRDPERLRRCDEWWEERQGDAAAPDLGGNGIEL